VMHMLAHWGARSLGPPTRDADLEPGWLAGAMQMAFPPHPTAARIEFRVGDEIASFADGEVREGPVESPDAVVECDPTGFFHFVVDRDLGCIAVEGDAPAVHRLLEALPYRDAPVAAAAT
jgi:hypothetical protein